MGDERNQRIRHDFGPHERRVPSLRAAKTCRKDQRVEGRQAILGNENEERLRLLAAPRALRYWLAGPPRRWRLRPSRRVPFDPIRCHNVLKARWSVTVDVPRSLEREPHVVSPAAVEELAVEGVQRCRSDVLERDPPTYGVTNARTSTRMPRVCCRQRSSSGRVAALPLTYPRDDSTAKPDPHPPTPTLGAAPAGWRSLAPGSGRPPSRQGRSPPLCANLVRVDPGHHTHHVPICLRMGTAAGKPHSG